VSLAFMGIASGAIPAAGRGVPVRPPELLSQTGLYAASGAIDPSNHVFVPQYPLWSDGAKKSRWIHLPEGSTIDVTHVDLWRFPAGTKLWKEFAWEGRKIETRMLWKAGEEWVFASYLWAEDQRDARLAPEGGLSNVFEIEPGKWHSIPSTGDCHACHESSPATVLGFNALQLSDDRDPLAPHAEPLPSGALTNRSLVESGKLDPPRPELASEPPRIRAASPTARAALGYLSANCGGCHNGSGPLSRIGLSLLHTEEEPSQTEAALRTAVDVPGRYRLPNVSADSSRVVAPGAPERSSLLYRVRSRRPASQMPPLGTVIADAEAVQLIERWIEELEPPHASAFLQADLQDGQRRSRR